jgi:hypothetical protein
MGLPFLFQRIPIRSDGRGIQRIAAFQDLLFLGGKFLQTENPLLFQAG